MAIFQCLWTPYSKLWAQFPGSPYFFQVGLVLPVTPPFHWEGFIFFSFLTIRESVATCRTARDHISTFPVYMKLNGL